MRNSFTKGVAIGSIIGATVGMALTGSMKPSTRKRIIKTGRTLIRKSNGIINDVIDILR